MNAWLKSPWALLIGAGAIAAVYIAYKSSKLVGQAHTAAVNAVSDKLTDWFGPKDTTESVYYTVTFPNGDRHAVGASTVAPDGLFQKIVPPYRATQWRMKVDATGKKFAVALE